MAFSWSTFLIEIVNFVVLVWLLTRFLYQPVLRAIEARRKMIAQDMQRAQDLQQQAKEESERYASRLAEWEREKKQLKDAFEAELDKERERQTTLLTQELIQQRERAKTEEKIRAREQAAELRAQADASAAKFAAEVLDRVASPELETRLIVATLEDLRAISADEQRRIKRAFAGRTEAGVTTRYPLSATQRAEIEIALRECVGTVPHLTMTQSEALIAGIRIDLGAIALEGNLAGELGWFANAHDGQF